MLYEPLDIIPIETQVSLEVLNHQSCMWLKATLAADIADDFFLAWMTADSLLWII